MIAGVLLVFLAGAALGGLGTRIYMERRIRGLVHEGPPAKLVPRFIGRMLRELDPPPERRAEVEAVARELQSELIELRGKYRPELETILSEHLDRIREKLTPEEQARMDEFRERRKWRRGRHAGPPGEHGPGEPGMERGRWLLEGLDLTPEQEEAVRPILGEFFQRRRMLAEKMRTATPEERPLVRREGVDLRRRTEARLSEALTGEQMERLRETGPFDGRRGRHRGFGPGME
jgi:Spy/CpxP family protein refolding chaperone